MRASRQPARQAKNWCRVQMWLEIKENPRLEAGLDGIRHLLWALLGDTWVVQAAAQRHLLGH